MLNVNDGDAIVIHLKRSLNQELVIIVDGGHRGDWQKVTSVADPLLAAAGKKGPDLVICSHFDSDHIGGLVKIANYYDENIGEVWIHHPGVLIEAVHLAHNLATKKSFVNEAKDFKSTMLAYPVTTHEIDHAIASYDDMVELVGFLSETKIVIKEPFPELELKGWPEIKILGPTKTFYNSLISEIGPKKVLLSEVLSFHEMLKSSEKVSKYNKARDPDACQYLDKQKKDKITEVNQISVIVQITVDQKKYLFTGDASLESFKNVPDYPNALNDIYWLKVAHHGSHNNSSSQLFSVMKPKFAYISGKKYFDEEVAECLRANGAIVKTTREDGDLSFIL